MQSRVLTRRAQRAAFHLAFWSGGIGALVGCSANTSVDPRFPVGVQPGFIKFYDRPIDIRVPASAAAGDTVTITAMTYGDGQCIKFADTEVSVDGRSVHVTPLDEFESRTGVWCPDILVSIEHSIRVPLHERGTVQVRVHGRQWPENKLISGEREIVVR